VALYAVRGLYEQANEHLAYKAKLSGINLDVDVWVLFFLAAQVPLLGTLLQTCRNDPQVRASGTLSR